MSLFGLLQAPSAPGWMWAVPYLLVFGILWLLIIRPQLKQQERQKNMISALKPGSKVVTTGGLHGTVVEVRDKTLSVRIAEKVKVEVTKTAVTALQEDSTDKE
jgi:preprotein translocase subunit YajC